MPGGAQLRRAPPQCRKIGRSRLQSLGALAVVAPAFLDPLEAAVPAIRLVRVVLVATSVHPRRSAFFLRILRVDGVREYGVACWRLRGGRRPPRSGGGARPGRRPPP